MNDDTGKDANTFNQEGQLVGKQVNIGRVEGRNVHIGDITQAAPKEITFPISNLPPANPHFIGRTAQLQTLEQTEQGPTTITQAIVGLGGVGKSQLMLHFAHQHRDAYDVIWWVRVEEALAEDFLALGRALGLELVGLKQDAAVQVVRNWLNGTERPWLLLCDNADETEPQRLRELLPSGTTGRILITSRNPRWQRLGQVVRLDVFSEKEAAVFWMKKFGDSVSPASTGSASEVAWMELAEELGRLPLALDHATAYMDSNDMDAAAYVKLYRARRQDLWQRAKPPADYHEATITTTWEIAFEKARKTPGAADLLNLCCFLATDDIPLDLIEEHAAVLPEELAKVLSDELALNDALNSLARYSLTERDAGMLRVHRLVQTVARDRMGEARAEKWVEATVNFLYAAYNFDRYDMTTWPAANRLIPHLVAAIGLAEKLVPLNSRVAYLNNLVGNNKVQFGNLMEAQTYYEKGLAIREEILGIEHPETAESLNNMGMLLQEMGDFEGARSYFKRSLAIRERILGIEHPDTAASLNDLGELLQALGDLEGAKPFKEQAVAIYEKVLGLDHPSTATSLNNLGYLLQKMGDLAEARPYFERALAIREQVLGANHPDTAVSLYNIGHLLRVMGDMAEAKPYLERALAIREQVLGAMHPDTAESLSYLGYLLYRMGDLAGARPYYERALAIQEQVLGGEHPDTAESLNLLGGLLLRMGDLERARPYYKQALAICMQVFGPEHPDTATSLNNMGLLLQKMGNLPGAWPYFEQAATIFKQTLGPNHPFTATTYLNLGKILLDLGELEKAKPYIERGLAIREMVLGPDHPETAWSLSILGKLFQAKEDLTKAQACFERALAVLEAKLGPEHPETKLVRGNLASLNK